MLATQAGLVGDPGSLSQNDHRVPSVYRGRWVAFLSCSVCLRFSTALVLQRYPASHTKQSTYPANSHSTLEPRPNYITLPVPIALGRFVVWLSGIPMLCQA